MVNQEIRKSAEVGYWPGKPSKRLEGDVTREATSDEVADLHKENARLKEMVADLVLRYDIVEKARICWINLYFKLNIFRLS